MEQDLNPGPQFHDVESIQTSKFILLILVMALVNCFRYKVSVMCHLGNNFTTALIQSCILCQFQSANHIKSEIIISVE